jgi:hypothetical protein
MAKFILSFDAVKTRFFPLISQIGINYRDGSLSKHDGDGDFEIKAGDRMPYFLIDGKSIYDQLRDPKFHLLIFSDGEHDHRGVHAGVESKFATVLDSHVVPIYPHVAEIFGTDKPFMLLLRPDNYIGFITREIEVRAVNSYLGQVIGTR